MVLKSCEKIVANLACDSRHSGL